MVILKQKIQITPGFSNFLREYTKKQMHNTRNSLIMTAVNKWCYLSAGKKNYYRYMKLKPKHSNKQKRSAAKKRKVFTVRNKAYGSKKPKTTGQVTNAAYFNYLRHFLRVNGGIESKELIKRAAKNWCKMKTKDRLRFKQQVQQSCKMKTCKKSP